MTSTEHRTYSKASASPAPAVSLRGVHKHFGDVHAVRGLDLEIRPGEIVAFLGPNGAGKTTTVDILLGLSRPTAGEVSVFGTDPRTAIAKGLVSAVMQTGGLLKELTVEETVRLTASLFADTRPVDEVLTRAGIADLGNRLVGKCSGGQQQRLRFAMALLSDPELLILDEPTTGMDVGARQDFWRTMREDAALGRTIVFATHYLAEADEFAERTVLMNHGRIVHDAATTAVRAAYGGRTLTFRPPASAVGTDAIDPAWLARVEQALAPLGVAALEVSAASLEAAFLALTTEPPADAVLEGATR